MEQNLPYFLKQQSSISRLILFHTFWKQTKSRYSINVALMFHLSFRYFNFRTTRFLTEEGFYNFHNWFDDRAWYPLGRIIGGTIYPGLMVTSAVLYHLMHFLHITIEIRNVCVFLAPFFSSLTVMVTYGLTKELKVSFLQYICKPLRNSFLIIIGFY